MTSSSSDPAVSVPSGVPAPCLERRLGPLDAVGIVVSNVMGGGIFYVPVIVAGLISSAWVMLAMWVCGGVFAFAGAMAYAELAALRPRAGGEYVYLREAFGQVRGISDRLDVVRGGFLRWHRGWIAGAGGLSRPVLPGGR